MRYGRVTPEQIARMAKRADAAGQHCLAAFLFALAVDHDAHQDLIFRIPRPSVDSDTIIRGHEIAARNP